MCHRTNIYSPFIVVYTIRKDTNGTLENDIGMKLSMHTTHFNAFLVPQQQKWKDYKSYFTLNHFIKTFQEFCNKSEFRKWKCSLENVYWGTIFLIYTILWFVFLSCLHSLSMDVVEILKRLNRNISSSFIFVCGVYFFGKCKK